MAQWVTVEGAAKDANGNYVALINGAWIPASQAAKDANGNYIAIIEQEEPQPKEQDSRSAVEKQIESEPWYKQAALGATGGFAAIGQGARQLTPKSWGMQPSEQELIDLAEFQKATRGTGAGLAGEFGSFILPGVGFGGAAAKAPLIAKGLAATGKGLVPAASRVGAMAGVGGIEGAGQGLLTPIMPDSDATRLGNVAEQGAFGAVAAPVFAGLLKGAGTVAEVTKPYLPKMPFSKGPTGAEVSQGKLLKSILGDDAARVQSALETAPKGMTAGQVAAQQQDTQLPALEAMLAKDYASTAAYRAKKAAEAARTQALTPDDAAALVAQRKAEAMPKMETALRKADIVTRAEQNLAAKAVAKDESAVSLLQDIGRMSTFGQQSANRAAKGAPGFISNADRAAEAGAATQDMSGIWRTLKDDSINYRKQLAALNDRGLKGIKVGEIVSDIGAIVRQPAIASSESAPALKAVMQRIAATKGNPEALYTIKKEINDIVSGTLKQADPNVSKKIASSVAAKITPMIDEAIDKASGGTWKDYLKTYSEISKKIDQANIMSRLQSTLAAPIEGGAERRVSFANAVNNPENLISKEAGRAYGSLEEVLTPEQMAIVNKVKGQLDVEATTREAAKAGADELRKKVKDISSYEGIGILDRAMTVAQNIIRRAKTGASERSLIQLSTKMDDPKAIAQLMKYADADEKRQLAAYLKVLRAQTSTAITLNRMGDDK